MSEQVVIERRFRGPPESANGGYACGCVARAIEPGPAVEVTLKAPPPLDTPLSLVGSGGGSELHHGGDLVADGKSRPWPDFEVPQPVGLGEAEAARRDSPMQQDHPYPECFVCGPHRRSGDGLRVTCGPVSGRDLVASPWKVDESVPHEDGVVRPELVWSVLDCPTGIAIMLVPEVGRSMLGRLTGVIERPVRVGERLVAIGWPIERDGRKFHSGAALFDESGQPVALSRAVWIELLEQPS